MAIQLFKEHLNGKYHGTAAATLLPKGWIVDGLNVRKVSETGGWKPRKGSIIHNPSNAIESGANIDSIHPYTNPRSADAHFILQANSKLTVLDDFPTGTYTAATDLGVTVGTTPGFSDVVGESMFYADGSGRPITYGGDNPYCTGFLVWDNSASAYVDYTRVVTDNRSTIATLGNAANDVYYVCASEIIDGIVLDLVTANTTDTTTVKVYSWVAGAWSERATGFSDGTLASSKTHAQDGTISWTRNSSDTMSVLGNIMGYWYKVEPQAALQDGVTVQKCRVTQDATNMTNKWNGVWNWVSGCRFYDQSGDTYIEALGKVSNESDTAYLDVSSSTTSDFLYIKTPEPAAGFGFALPQGYTNTGAASNVDNIDYWNGNAWTTISSGITDTTLDGASAISFNQSGWIFFNAAAITPVRRTWQGDQVPGYWYRLSWDAAMSADTRIFTVLYAPHPEELPAYDGCVEFKGRLFVWGDPEYPNRLRYSAYRRGDCFSGSDSGYTDEMGGMSKIICAIKFYNELIVFKKDGVWLLEGYAPQNFGTLQLADTIGLASPKSAQVVEVGSPTMHRNEPLSIAIWQDTDGVYVLDGRKPRKVSGPIEHYFNTEYATAIAAASIENRQSYIDPLNNEYHLLLPSSELVYNYVTDEWYPPWEREIDLLCGTVLRGSDNRYYTYGGDTNGFVHRLENDTTDKTTGNADKVITHHIKTRAIAAGQDGGPTMRFNFIKYWAELKARASGDVTVNFFANMATSGTSTGTLSMVASGKDIAVPMKKYAQKDLNSFQLQFYLATADAEMEIWGYLYEAEVMGEIGV
jgi:hypothetical protein